MHLLAALNILLVGLWAGMYLFTTFVVSPAFVQLFPDSTERSAHRRALGRVYARVNAPLTVLLLLTALTLGFWHGWTWALGAELALLLLIGGLVATHVRQGENPDHLPAAWLTNVTLGAVVGVCVAALWVSVLGL